MAKIAYSYIRFSNEAQAEGDSLRRQLEATRSYCHEKGLILDDSLALQDLGVSAWEGKNAEKGALGRFLAACRSGRITRGSALVVENLDRISRQSPRKTVRLLGEILDDHGIEIHLTQAGKIFHPEEEENEGIDLILAVALSMRAHEESKTKSRRLKEAWSEKRRKVIEEGHILTHTTPWWLEWAETEFRIIEERAAVVRKIYEMTADGLSAVKIARELNLLRIQPPGRYRDKKKEKVYTVWRESSIKLWLTTKSPEGFLRATWKTRLKAGDYVVEDYYPRIVDDDLAARAHAGRKVVIGRPPKPGREPNIWKGINLRAHDATTGPDGHWCRWGGTRNGVKDSETGLKAIHYYVDSISDVDGHAIINCSTRMLERLVSIAVAKASEIPTFGGFLAPDPDPTVREEHLKSLSAVVLDAEARLENLLKLAESGKAPTSVLKRIEQAETIRERAKADLQTAKLATRSKQAPPSAEDIAWLMSTGKPPDELKSHPVSRSDVGAILRRLISRIDIAKDVKHLIGIGRFGEGIVTTWPWGGVVNRKVVALIEFTGGVRWLATNKPGEIALKVSTAPVAKN